MLVHTKKLITNIIYKREKMMTEITYNLVDDTHMSINLKIPLDEFNNVTNVIRSALSNSGHAVTETDENGERLYTIEEVFPEASPGMMLRGLRGKLELTQIQFAKRLGVSQHHISEIENSKRTIGIDMDKRLADEFNVPYKLFL
jgi:DNA-binding XRE family transcriptional regulator